MKDFARRMFRYFARLHEKFELACLPCGDLLVRSAAAAGAGIRWISQTFGSSTSPSARSSSTDSTGAISSPPNPVASALMTKMRIAPEDRPRVKLECLRMLATLKLDKARSTLIGAFMANYLKLTARETAVYNRMLESVAPKERKVVMQLTNEWIEQGVKKGLQQGRQEGGQEGARDLVLRQLRRRLGGLPAKLAREVNRLDDADVFALGDALLDFTGPADAQRWLARRK
jgi:hypothetical protein